jgi:hypothetical protein
MVKVFRNKLFAIPEQGDQWLRNIHYAYKIGKVYLLCGTVWGYATPLTLKW